MLEIAVAVGICLVLLGAWFILPIGLAEVLLALFVVSAGALGVYQFWTGKHVYDAVEGVGIFVLLAIILGSMRVGVEKLSEMFGRLASTRHR
jgi:hypothetical protein